MNKGIVLICIIQMEWPIGLCTVWHKGCVTNNTSHQYICTTKISQFNIYRRLINAMILKTMLLWHNLNQNAIWERSPQNDYYKSRLDFSKFLWLLIEYIDRFHCISKRPNIFGRFDIQWNLSVTTTSIIKFITCDLINIVLNWRQRVPIYSC